jgi:mono/diheme cytochrome c family protein
VKDRRSPYLLRSCSACAACHAPGAQFHAQLAAAKGKDVEQLTRWIRNPEKFKPGTQMPTFASILSESQARALASWVSRQ